MMMMAMAAAMNRMFLFLSFLALALNATSQPSEQNCLPVGIA